MFHYSQGRHNKQGHKAIPEGYYEEEQGRKGFSGPVSHLIKERPSTRWMSIEGKLRPHLYDSNKINISNPDWVRMFYNQDLSIYTQGLSPDNVPFNHSFRNADGETLYFCHEGEGCFITEFGLLKFRKGSYILIPKCVNFSILPKNSSRFLIIESKTSSYSEPDRGMVGRNAFYDTEAFGKPDLDEQIELLKNQSFKFNEILVKRADEITRFKYQDCVYDTIGWKGDFFPITLHVDDLMPLLSARVHLPPSAHSTFVSRNFVVCTFLPRPLESDSDALKVPFYHQNIDYDEVLFYHAGNFFSRDNIQPGAISFHPAGFPHGPHPKATENVKSQTHTNEYAVMIDTWNPLFVDKVLIETEITEYWKSWMK